MFSCFVAAVSRFDKNLKAASRSRDQILNPFALKQLWEFYGKVIEMARFAPCHQSTKPVLEMPLTHQLHRAGYDLTVFNEGLLQLPITEE